MIQSIKELTLAFIKRNVTTGLNPIITIEDFMSGPAHTHTINTDFTNFMLDFVPTLTCECQHILHEWASRSRKYDWPPQSVRQQITHMNGNLYER